MKIIIFLDDFFKNIFKRLEDEKTSIWYYICSFIFIVLLRDFLEFVFYHFENVDFQFVVHFSLYYVVLALFAIIFFQYFAKEKISKVARVVLPTFIILLTPIIVDGIISVFKSPIAAPAYIYPLGAADLITRFFTFFGSVESGAGITFGMKVEIALLLLLIFFYLRYKRCNIKKSILGIFLFYLVIFISFITPSIIDLIQWVSYFWIFAIRGMTVSIESAYSEFVFINFFLIIVFVLSAMIFRLWDRKLFEKILEEIKFRFSRILHFCAMAILGIAFASKNFGSLENINLPLIDYILSFLCLLLSIACFFIFSCMINNIVDRVSDLLSGNRPITYQKTDNKRFLLAICLVFLFGTLFALAVNSEALLIMICFTGAYFIYSVPPFRLKKIGFISKLIIGFNSLLLVLLGYFLVPNGGSLDIHSFNSLTAFPVKYAIFVLCFSLPINYIDLKDMIGDKSEGIKTLPVLLGLERAKILVGLSFLALYLSTYFILKNPTLLVLFAIGGLIQFYVVNRKKYSDALVSYSYLAGMAVFIFFVLKK